MGPTDYNIAGLQQALKDAGARWEGGATQFTALAPEQKRRLLGYRPGPDEDSLEGRERAALAKLRAPMLAAGAPASFDLRNVGGKNYITSIKNQASCGSCVSFGTVATVEGTLRWQRNDPSLAVDYSEAHLFYCIGKGDANCDDGWSVKPALDGFEDTGVADEACFPYTSSDHTCHPCGDWQNRVTKITGWHSIDSHSEMKQWLSTRGPLVTCFTVYDDFFAYKSGVYSHHSGDKAGGHCVSCVGYNDAGGYWICKNSWGSGFGESGFFRIAYGQVGIDSTMWAVEGVQAGLGYSGVWRGGSDGYYLWVNADWPSFQAKWTELSKQNLRLVDLEPYTLGGKRVWAGVWRSGSDGHYLWANANWANFQAKWDELSKQGLRLTVLSTYEEGGTRLYAGVWRAGTDGYYLWVGADWASFQAKWNDLSKQNLRLVDLDTYIVDGKRVWAGVWRSGSDGHFLWVNADWNNFQAKWSELAKQNLRLTVLTSYRDGGKTLYAGVWREGSDAYYLWVNASWDNFLAKWTELGKQNLRLIHLDTLASSGTSLAGLTEAGDGNPGAGLGGGGSAAEIGAGEGGGEGGCGCDGSAGEPGAVDSAASDIGAGEGGGSIDVQIGAGEGGGSIGTEVSAGEGGGSSGSETTGGQGAGQY